MKKYEVCFHDEGTGAVSPVDTIVMPDEYTPEDYLKDCEANGVYWGNGTITFTEIEEE